MRHPVENPLMFGIFIRYITQTITGLFKPRYLIISVVKRFLKSRLQLYNCADTHTHSLTQNALRFMAHQQRFNGILCLCTLTWECTPGLCNVHTLTHVHTNTHKHGRTAIKIFAGSSALPHKCVRH